jgi:hypothetical protein
MPNLNGMSTSVAQPFSQDGCSYYDHSWDDFIPLTSCEGGGRFSEAAMQTENLKLPQNTKSPQENKLVSPKPKMSSLIKLFGEFGVFMTEVSRDSLTE